MIIGRTGSSQTTVRRETAAALGVPHVELDSLYFGPDFSPVPLPVFRQHTSAAIVYGNKSAGQDLVWLRADKIIWLDYPLTVSIWRLGKRAIWRTSVLQTQAAEAGDKAGLFKNLFQPQKKNSLRFGPYGTAS